MKKGLASRQTAWCWAYFCRASGLFLRIKPPVCRLLFFAILTRCPLFVVALCVFGIENGHLSLYREKAREEKEGERRLWERCVNRLRFSTVSIAAAREKRERWLSRSGGLQPLFGCIGAVPQSGGYILAAASSELARIIQKASYKSGEDGAVRRIYCSIPLNKLCGSASAPPGDLILMGTVNIIYAALRDWAPFELRPSEIHVKMICGKAA